jgi:prepilin-type processing-associated H-X9-DG protein/prepilin-type N-terminal cleavage/methylation domain-containing protein
MKFPNRSGREHTISKKGFTIVELLIVITILIVLAFLSFIGMSKIKSKARGATCASNLRQIGTAMVAYAVENNGQLPPLEDRTGANDGLRGIWPVIVADGGHLDKAINRNGQLGCGAGVWACPDCKIVQKNYNGYGVAEGTVMKVKKGSNLNYRAPRINTIPNPSRTWLVGDAANNPSDLKTGWYAIWGNPNQWQNSHSPAARHGGKVNVIMVDGHLESLTMSDLRAKDYTMSGQ